MKYFTYSELTTSDAARRLGIANRPTPAAEQNLEALADYLLDPLRGAYGKPIRVNSGYRSPEVNQAVGGARNSQHVRGEAADITAGSVEENRKLFDLVQQLGLPFDQLIDERGYAWVHVSHRRVGGNRMQILHLK
jgi:hypothetical protein